MPIGAIVDAIREDIDVMRAMKVDGHPPGTAPISAQNGTVLAASATPQEIVGAPAAGKRIVVKQVVFTNSTAGQIAILDLQDEDDNLEAGPFMVGDPAIDEQGTLRVVFDVPLRLPLAKALEVHCTGDVGDSFAHVTGWIETP